MTELSLMQLAPTIAAVLGLPAPNGCRLEAGAPTEGCRLEAGAPTAGASTATAIPEIVADLQGAERLAVLAPDALGVHPFTVWRHEMPYLDSLHQRRSLVLRGVMPTITPVNFATIVTGTDQRGHGIQNFKDGFACETLFDVVRAHGGQSAGVGQKGYTGSELLGRHADFWGKAESNTDAEVAQIALGLAREHRPQFLIVQLGSTDDVLHRYGPSSPEVVPVLRETDDRLREMVGELTGLGYAIIITSDHGQHDAEAGSKRHGTHGTEMDEDALVPCTWVAAR
ncbi:MAG: alkaline phosphatase family protein [Armatimonadetes bacterium]|nr:alkaline phosphatase family protein [Armatimonadota bacterium]